MAEKVDEEELQAEAAGGAENLPKAEKIKTGLQESRHYSVISQTLADGRIMVGPDVQLFPDQECPNLASPGTKAFNAKDRRLQSEQFVILCGRSAVPRVGMISAYKGLKSKNILKLVDAGIIQWTPEGRQRLGLIFDKPPGKKMLSSPEEQPLRIHEDRLVQTLIQPVVSTLQEMKNADLTHGAIHPGNIFLSGAEGLETVVLGECLSSAPSSWQHPLYEVSMRAMAKPSGRGPGTVKDDLYALGVCAVTTALGKNLLAGRSLQDLLYDKIEQGSYMAILGQERIPGGIAEFLRGVLNDDEEQRWDIEDATRWLEGRRLAPKQSQVHLKAARPLVFKGQKHWDLRSVAASFAQNPAEATVEIDKGQFELWLKRNFDDKNLRARFDKIWEREKAEQPEKILCYTCMALDPFGPIRYKDQFIFPYGFGTALAVAMSNGEDIQVYAEIILQQFVANWFGQIAEVTPDAAVMTGLFEKCRAALSQRMLGYGIERILYLLNPEVACLSPLLKNYFVLVPGGLLLVLEELSRLPERPLAILDRHMISFISVREPKMIDQYLGNFNSPSKGRQVAGIIRTLAAIQRRFSIGLVPGVGNWLISMTPVLVESLNDHDLRQMMTRQVNKLTDNGNLTALLDVVDDPLLIQDDRQRFAMACNEYARLVQEKGDIESNLRKRKTFGRTMGRQIAMISSSVLATVIIAAYVVLRLTRGF